MIDQVRPGRKTMAELLKWHFLAKRTVGNKSALLASQSADRKTNRHTKLHWKMPTNPTLGPFCPDPVISHLSEMSMALGT